MKSFKKVDCFIQVGLFIAAVLVLVVFGTTNINALLTLYFAVGGWQVISMFVHWGYDKEYKIRLRMIYQIALAATLVVGLVSIVGNFVLEYMFGILFWSPVLAIVYLICSLIEKQRLEEMEKAKQLENAKL